MRVEKRSGPRSGNEPGLFDDVFDRKSLDAAQHSSVERRRRRRRGGRGAVDGLGEQASVGERVTGQRPASQRCAAVHNHAPEQAAVYQSTSPRPSNLYCIIQL